MYVQAWDNGRVDQQSSYFEHVPVGIRLSRLLPLVPRYGECGNETVWTVKDERIYGGISKQICVVFVAGV
jgi:hypothetical protein